ncbi:MAG: GTPase Era [Archangium sp.]|nr:GTPase Era [Archangium sp.]
MTDSGTDGGDSTPRVFRSGFAALIGRPNVGKSTLLNRLLGEKVAIVSPKPQTTRTKILGVINVPNGQIAFVDTPGVHQAKGALNAFMVDVAQGAAEDADVVLLVIEAEGLREDRTPEIGPGNKQILQRLQRVGKPVILVINKIDTVKKKLLLPMIAVWREAFPFVDVLPIAAKTGEGVDALRAVVLPLLPEGQPLYAEDVFTDQEERSLASEFIREQVLRHTRQEIPYSTAVVIEVFDETDRFTPPPERKTKKGGKAPTPPKGPRLTGLVRIHASVFVERESQKAIIIGKQGQMLKTIGTDARHAIERLIGANVYLSLQIKVEPRWSERPDGLRKLGYTAT